MSHHVHEEAATRILKWLHRAETSLIGVTVVTFNGESGAVQAIKLDEHHGLCFTFDNADDNAHFYPVSTIRMKS